MSKNSIILDGANTSTVYSCANGTLRLTGNNSDALASKSSPIKHNFTEQQVTIDSNITEMLIVFDNVCNLVVNMNSNNVVLSNYRYNNKIKIIETKSCNNNLTLNSEKNSFKITNIPINHSIRVNTVKQAKKHLIAKKVLLDGSQQIESQFSKMGSLEQAAQTEFLRDNIIRKDNEFPLPTDQMNFGNGLPLKSLPNEITDLIVFFVDGKVKSCNINDTFTVIHESYNSLKLLNIPILGLDLNFSIL